MQVKKILAYALTVCLLISATVVPAYAVDEVTEPVIYYTEDYYPGAVAEMRNSGLFANNRLAYGSYAALNYNPSWLYIYKNTGNLAVGDFSGLTPSVIADNTDVSAVYTIPATTLLTGNQFSIDLPSTDDCYFDFQSSNILYDQQDANANTFYINGDLTFSFRNLWDFRDASKNASWYLASDPLAVQLLIDGKAYGDIIDVTGYTSPFTALYNGGVPADATVTFNNLKVYYQGDTPEFIGFRVYSGSAFVDDSYVFGDFMALNITNTITMRFTDIPDITFVQEGGDGYAGDLSGISGILSSMSSALSTISSTLSNFYNRFHTAVGDAFLSMYGTELQTSSTVSLTYLIRHGFLGIRRHLVDSSSGTSWLSILNSNLNSGIQQVTSGITNSTQQINSTLVSGLKNSSGTSWLQIINGSVTNGLNSVNASLTDDTGAEWLSSIWTVLYNFRNYFSNTVFPWQSYNMETHELNAATNITGQNNLFFTAFQSIEDKLGRLAYVFGSDEDLALKDSADPGTDAFRENFGGGASLSDIKDASELTTTIPQIMDSGFDFGDVLEEIGSNDDFLKWFTSETWAALDSTGAAVAADPDYLSDYYDNLRKVEEKRHWGD